MRRFIDGRRRRRACVCGAHSSSSALAISASVCTRAVRETNRSRSPAPLSSAPDSRLCSSSGHGHRGPCEQGRVGRSRGHAVVHASSACACPSWSSHFFLAHVAALRRDHERLGWASHEADAMPLGSGAVAGTNSAIDTAMLAVTPRFLTGVSPTASTPRPIATSLLGSCTRAR